jgi:hypothetical protein
MFTSVYTGLNPFNFIRKHFLQICVRKVAMHLYKVLKVMSTSVDTDLNQINVLERQCTTTSRTHCIYHYMLRMDRVKPPIAHHAINATHGEWAGDTFQCAGVTGEENEKGWANVAVSDFQILETRWIDVQLSIFRMWFWLLQLFDFAVSTCCVPMRYVARPVMFDSLLKEAQELLQYWLKVIGVLASSHLACGSAIVRRKYS